MVKRFGLSKQHQILKLSPEDRTLIDVCVEFGQYFGQSGQMSCRSSVFLSVPNTS